ncbi:hypothetical protein M9Y10_025214 [Tritrichomonas musculus]|uniref:Uncharacterized protein n=1 Tax=Tritrichomonas musculus TaxID=1915356 RepID=A0ABR2HC94_9EUKA
MSEGEEKAELSIGDSSSIPADSDIDKPNITVDAQKQVHYHNDNEEITEGSIILGDQNKVATDVTKDPVIQPKTEKEVANNSQSKCCLLI